MSMLVVHLSETLWMLFKSDTEHGLLKTLVEGFSMIVCAFVIDKYVLTEYMIDYHVRKLTGFNPTETTRPTRRL